MSLDTPKQSLYLTLSGLAATFVGNGIGRFAFIALFPAIIQKAWFNYTQTSYLGSATLFGYLIGVPLCNYLVKKVSVVHLLRIAMMFCSMSYLLCTWPEAGFSWFLFWRTITGLCGAVLMILAPSNVLAKLTQEKRNRAAGIVFSGVGLGAVASGTLVPFLLLFGLQITWFTLGIICLVLTIVTWNQWKPIPVQHADKIRKTNHRWPITLLVIAYTLNAVGYLPHTLFWVDYITRELHHSMPMGGFLWAIFGFGAMIGPMTTSWLANRFDLLPVLLLSFFLKSVGVALPLISNHFVALFFSSLLVGMFTPGVVNIVSAYALELVGIARFQQVWGWLTFAFAGAQAFISYVMIYIMFHSVSYKPLFIISALALLVSCGCIILLNKNTKRSRLLEVYIGAQENKYA